MTGGEIERYSFEDNAGCEQTYTTFDATEARETCIRNGWRCIAHQYSWEGSEPVWDYTAATINRELARRDAEVG